MGRFLLVFVSLIIFQASGFAQQNIEKEIKKIRSQYQQIVSEKSNLTIEKDNYDWERDDLIPSLSEEDMEHEYNEQGNFTANKKTYKDQKGNVQLIEIDDETSWYQEGKNRTRHREYYFWQGELFFYFEHTHVAYSDETIESRTFEHRIYIKEDQIIRWLGKEAEGNPDMANILNYNIDVKTGYLHDYHLLDAYSLNPDW
jgi:hypothetical protein